MLTIYRRHRKTCEYRSEGRRYRRCRCPIWVDGRLDGREIRKSLGVGNWEKAQGIVRDWEAEGQIEQRPDRPSVEAGCEAFLTDLDRRGLVKSTVAKYNLLFRELREYSGHRGLRYLDELSLAEMRGFCSSWTQGNHTALKKLERLRSFMRFALDAGWVLENVATKIKSPTVRRRPTLPFTQEEMVQILRACDSYAGDRTRIRAFVLLLRYSGLRIGDAARLRKDQLNDGKLLLHVQKTGVPVYVPLPDLVVDEMHKMTAASETYYFWSGTSDPDGIARTWMKYLHKLFGLAGVEGGHAHRFRDTFAVELLLEGVPIERVAILLGHASIKVTERHYSPWVQARQAQLEADVRRTWKRDSLIFSQTKGTSEVHAEQPLVN